MSSISREQVAHLGTLARIELSDAELDTMAGELGVILEAVRVVGEIASDDVPPMSHPMPLVNVMRDDQVRPGLTAQQALAGAPSVQDHSFTVPRILGEE